MHRHVCTCASLYGLVVPRAPTLTLGRLCDETQLQNGGKSLRRRKEIIREQRNVYDKTVKPYTLWHITALRPNATTK